MPTNISDNTGIMVDGDDVNVILSIETWHLQSSNEDITHTVWVCGVDKSIGGRFNFEFFFEFAPILMIPVDGIILRIDLISFGSVLNGVQRFVEVRLQVKLWKDLLIGDKLLKLSIPPRMTDCLGLKWRWCFSSQVMFDLTGKLLYLDRLPTRSNLSRRNVSLPSLACPLCDHSARDIVPFILRLLLAKDIPKFIVDVVNLECFILLSRTKMCSLEPILFASPIPLKHQMNDMVNGKWMTVRSKVANFCGVFDNVTQMERSVANEGDVFNRHT
ncbi:hypothetical protein Tco_0625605 [Tanacetum coccineum]|uniref:Uncharacterized protein n=1 Tax=Tanacetum coccineum TaxID=301880 RepID=A0ABQ4WH78_9ASTR